MHTRETLKAKLDKNDRAVARAIVALCDTESFATRDKEFGSSLARQVIIWQSETYPPTPYPLSPNQIKAARRIVAHYLDILISITNEKG